MNIGRGTSRICNVLRHGYWVPKLRVVGSGICRGSGGFGASGPQGFSGFPQVANVQVCNKCEEWGVVLLEEGS